MLSTLSKILQAAPVLTYTFAILAYCIEGKRIYLYFLLGLFVLCTLLNSLLKMFFKRFFSNVDVFDRPNPPKSGCGCFSNDTYEENKSSFGMPSGHAQMVFFFASFWTCYLHSKNSNISEILRSIILWLFALMVSFQRIYSGCHNLLQIFVGGLIGIILGVLYFNLINRLKLI